VLPGSCSQAQRNRGERGNRRNPRGATTVWIGCSVGGGCRLDRHYATPLQRRSGAYAGATLGRQTRPVMRIIVIVALIAVVAALFTALVFLYRDRGRGNRVVAALAIRVLLSMALIAFLVFSWWMGWIAPGGL
jgi:hypothetical protein